MYMIMLYKEYLEIYFDQYMAFLDAEKRKLDNKYNGQDLFLEGYDYSVLSEESTDKEESTNIPSMPPEEGDEEKVKEEK